MQPNFNILVNIDERTPARFLLTDAQAEKDFLLFSQSVTSLEQSIRFYTNIVGLCGIKCDLSLLFDKYFHL
jgi:hypothetical protein